MRTGNQHSMVPDNDVEVWKLYAIPCCRIFMALSRLHFWGVTRIMQKLTWEYEKGIGMNDNAIVLHCGVCITLHSTIGDIYI